MAASNETNENKITSEQKKVRQAGQAVVDPLVLANREVTQATAKRKALWRKYKGENRVSVYLSPMYRPYFSNIMTVTINGISIAFPVDGNKYDIPKTFADEIERRRIYVDSIIKKQKKMANIVDNFENTPGELELF